MARSPQQQALRDRSKAIKNPVQGNKDDKYTFDKKDEGYFHIKYTPLRVSKTLNKSSVVELEDASAIQKHRPEVYEELKHNGFFERRDVKATVLHDPTKSSEPEDKKSSEELSPQQRAAITRKENEERKKAEEGK